MTDKQAKDYLKELSGLTDYLKKVEQQVAGAEQRLASLKANAEELDAANRGAAAELGSLNTKISKAREQYEQLVAVAQFDANATRAKADEYARKTKADADKQVADRLAAIRAAAAA